MAAPRLHIVISGALAFIATNVLLSAGHQSPAGTLFPAHALQRTLLSDSGRGQPHSPVVDPDQCEKTRRLVALRCHRRRLAMGDHGPADAAPWRDLPVRWPPRPGWLRHFCSVAGNLSALLHFDGSTVKKREKELAPDSLSERFSGCRRDSSVTRWPRWSRRNFERSTRIARFRMAYGMSCFFGVILFAPACTASVAAALAFCNTRCR